MLKYTEWNMYALALYEETSPLKAAFTFHSLKTPAVITKNCRQNQQCNIMTKDKNVLLCFSTLPSTELGYLLQCNFWLVSDRSTGVVPTLTIARDLRQGNISIPAVINQAQAHAGRLQLWTQQAHVHHLQVTDTRWMTSIVSATCITYKLTVILYSVSFTVPHWLQVNIVILYLVIFTVPHQLQVDTVILYSVSPTIPHQLQVNTVALYSVSFTVPHHLQVLTAHIDLPPS